MSDPDQGRETDRRVCRHPDAEELGFDRDAEFRRCVSCGEVLVRHRGRAWAIRPAAH
ncbi:MAG TPA: hypothetical protein VF992_03675 [Thermoplasmata archaeon]